MGSMLLAVISFDFLNGNEMGKTNYKQKVRIFCNLIVSNSITITYINQFRNGKYTNKKNEFFREYSF